MNDMRRYLLSLSLLVAAAVQAQQFGSILGSVEANNVSLQAARRGMEADASERRAANTLGATSVEYSPFFEGGADGMASSELIVSQEFDFPSLYSGRRKVAHGADEVASVEYMILRRDVLLQAQTLCVDLLATERGADLLAKRKAVTDSLVATVARRMENGEATRLDVNRLRMESMELQAEEAGNASRRNELLASLRELNGGADVDSLWSRYADDALPVCSIADTVAPGSVLESRHADASLRLAKQESKAQRQGWLPSLTMGYRRNTDFGTPSHGVLLGASFPLFSHSGKAKAARQRQEAAELDLKDALQKERAEMDKLRSEAAALTETLKAYDEDLMYETLRLLRKGVEAGEIPVADYYTQSDYIYTKLQEKQDLTVRLYKVCAQYAANSL